MNSSNQIFMPIFHVFCSFFLPSYSFPAFDGRVWTLFLAFSTVRRHSIILPLQIKSDWIFGNFQNRVDGILQVRIRASVWRQITRDRQAAAIPRNKEQKYRRKIDIYDEMDFILSAHFSMGKLKFVLRIDAWHKIDKRRKRIAKSPISAYKTKNHRKCTKSGFFHRFKMQ